MRAEYRGAPAGVVRRATEAYAGARQRRLLRGHQGQDGQDRRRGAEQMVTPLTVHLT